MATDSKTAGPGPLLLVSETQPQCPQTERDTQTHNTNSASHTDGHRCCLQEHPHARLPLKTSPENYSPSSSWAARGRMAPVKQCRGRNITLSRLTGKNTFVNPSRTGLISLSASQLFLPSCIFLTWQTLRSAFLPTSGLRFIYIILIALYYCGL